MIVDLPIVVFMIALLVAYGTTGLRRQAATVVMLLGAAWSLALLVDPATIIWAVGPLLATLLLPRPAERVPSTFEVLTRRVLTIAGLMLLALFLASRLAFGENPLLLNVVPWFLGAVGAAWVASPIDTRERVQGQVLMVGATGALLVAAVPAGVVTVALTGGTALVPVMAGRGLAAWRPLLSPLMLLGAAAAAVAAAIGLNIPALAVADFSVNLAGPVLVGLAVLLVAGAARAPLGSEWMALLGGVALVAPAPSLRWSAIAALVAAATALDRSGERPAWIAVGALATVPILPPLASPTWSARAQAVALAIGLVVMAYAARSGLLRVLALPAVGFLVLLAVGSLSPGNLTRFQWIAAVGALLLLTRTVITRLARSPVAILTDQLIVGLALLGLAARDGSGLGALAAVLLLIDVAIVRLDDFSGIAPRLVSWARSNWPGSITFAGGTLAVIAALQASLALGLLAALLLAGLQLAPLFDGPPQAPERPRSRMGWLAPALSFTFGVAPALMLRMLRL